MLDVTRAETVATLPLEGQIQATTTCEQCGQPFEPRKGSGGKPQRFCSPECRQAFHAEPQRSQRSEPHVGKQTLALIAQPAKAEAALAAKPEADGDSYWTIPPQNEIDVMAVCDGSVEIYQRSPLRSEEDQRIDVAAVNCVALARRILWAAGFEGILIARCEGGGFVDLNDGSKPDDFAP